MSFYITKASGEKELFDIKKFRRSLKKAGASPDIIDKLAKKIQKKSKLRNTKEIYQFALDYLHKVSPPTAARYNIKRALIELGPTGFSFEQFIAKLFEKQKYNVKTNQVVEGWCVDHELDIIASKKREHLMIECKFHSRQGKKTDVKVSLYIKARFDDVKKVWEQNPQHQVAFHQAWIATNTKFTSKAIQYAECTNIKLLGWSYPPQKSLPDLINAYGLHPITALTSLSGKEKKLLIKEGFVLCRDAQNYQELLQRLQFTPHRIKKLIKEAEEVCRH